MLRFLDDRDSEDEDLSGYVLDPNESELTGLVLHDQPEIVLWTIHLEWLDEGTEESSFEDAWGEVSHLVFGENGWRDLVGKQTRVAYEEKDVHPILPDNPANFYLFCEHHVPNQNHVRITGRDGRNFTLNWTCRIESGRPPGEPLEIDETVAFKEMSVYFADESGVDVTAARRVLKRHIALSELGKPTVSRKWVNFPIRARVK